MAPGGLVHLKTDSKTLYDYTLEVIDHENCKIASRIDDVYRDAPDVDLLTIKTYYEKKHLEAGKIIRYVSFLL